MNIVLHSASKRIYQGLTPLRREPLYDTTPEEVEFYPNVLQSPKSMKDQIQPPH